jgi:hypothetical protein
VAGDHAVLLVKAVVVGSGVQGSQEMYLVNGKRDKSWSSRENRNNGPNWLEAMWSEERAELMSEM